jgi:hypothetical protein
MKRRFLLWGGFRLEPSRRVQAPAVPQPSAAAPTAGERAAAQVVRLERQLEKQGAGLGV